MTGVLTAAAALCGLLGLAAAGAVLLRTRDPRLAGRVLLDLLLAGVLLGLGADTGWPALLVAALVVGLRCLLVVGMSRNPTGG